jgi:tRNA A-37 threonylcarbamoyl transferase component Bud32
MASSMIREALKRRRATMRIATRASSVIGATSGAGLLLIATAAACVQQDANDSDDGDKIADSRHNKSSSGLTTSNNSSGLESLLPPLPAFVSQGHILHFGGSKRTCQCEAAAIQSPPSPAALDLSRRLTLRRMNSEATENTVEALYNIDPVPLGEGAYGEVYYATDKRTGEGVALKRISKEYTDELEFQREMNALLHVRACGGHPNICQLRENFEEDDNFILILDLIRGGEMFEYLIDNGAYSEWEAARLIREVASALTFLHGVGIVHADLKPENLMLSSKNKDEATIKVVDFGCAGKKFVFPLTGYCLRLFCLLL